MRLSIAEKSSLNNYTMFLKDVHASLVVLTLAFPPDALDFVILALDEQFLRGYDIIPASVCIDEKPLQEVISMRSHELEKIRVDRQPLEQLQLENEDRDQIMQDNIPAMPKHYDTETVS